MMGKLSLNGSFMESVKLDSFRSFLKLALGLPLLELRKLPSRDGESFETLREDVKTSVPVP